MKPIHLILSIALLAGGACGDQQENLITAIQK